LSYSVIYLENHKCKFCKEIGRNVIEPVAVFVPEGEEEKWESELEKLDSEQLEQRLKEVYRNVKWYKKESANFKTCIFHCEKENEIWIENYNDEYEKYAKRFYETIKERKPFNEKFEIKWNKNLVNEFWKRIRAYRFAVNYKEKWDEFEGTEVEKWKQLKHQLPKETQNEIEKDKYLILANLKDLKEDEIFYNFKNFIFPEFQDYNLLNLQEEKEIYIVPRTLNFFYSHDELNFKYKIDFTEVKFHGLVIFFWNAIFC